MIQMEVIKRVLRISFKNSFATAFTLEQNGTQFLITAKHLFQKNCYPNSADIQILIDSAYKTFSCDIKYPDNPQIDIAVIKTNPYQMLSQPYTNDFTSTGLVLGQDVFFLGYPYDFDRYLAGTSDDTTPIPFVKKACMSGMKSPSPSILFLDGHNNPGFSGGPVCFKKIGSNLFSIAGVISGYNSAKTPVYQHDEQDLSKEIETGSYIKENTGIINAADISFAVDICKKWTD